MPESGVRSTYSQRPIQILMHDSQGLLSTGTAFFYSTADEIFLVTNWHNVSGKHPFDQTYLTKNHRSPTLLKAKMARWLGDTASGSFGIVPCNIPLYTDGQSQPVWFEHPTLASRCDVVALPFPKPSFVPDFMHNSANRISHTRIPVKPGGVAFIIGFPRSLSVGFGLPILKSGYIASEPFYDVTLGGKVSETGGLQGGTKLPAFF